VRDLVALPDVGRAAVVAGDGAAAELDRILLAGRGLRAAGRRRLWYRAEREILERRLLEGADLTGCLDTASGLPVRAVGREHDRSQPGHDHQADRGGDDELDQGETGLHVLGRQEEALHL